MFASANTAHFSLLIPAIRNDFKVLAFEGVEAISTLYAIKVELVSEYPDFDIEPLLSQPAFLQFGINGEGIHGRIEDVSAGETGKRLTHYQLTLVPALHYLQFSHNQRIFQHQTVPQIIAQVLSGHGIQADTYTFNVSSSPEREYCTQYLESDFELIQRLCSEDGISWHHQHSQDGHQLVFTDSQTHFPKLGDTPYQQGTGLAADHPVISRFSQRVSTRTSLVTRRAYDLQRPSLLLESQSRTDSNPRLEDYRYPVEMDTLAHGKLLAKHALERHRADYLVAEGHSDQPTLRSGHFFGLVDHPRPQCNDLWLLLGIHHEGKQPQVLEETVTSDVKSGDGFTQGYRNSFSAIPWDVFYRPPLVTRPSVLVSQTARVTGPPGEEIFCDELGRVRCEFHWDRAELNSDKSSCWLRVSSSWAGSGYGAVTIPRVGMEVVVTFLEGNPDKPLITGCVPNKITSVPYSLPENKTKTVLRSQSSPDNGGYNELSIEDRAGKELIYLRAQRDIEQKIENDSRLEVGNERHETIKGNSVAVLEAEDQRTVTADRKVELKSNDYLQVADSSHTRVGQTLVVEAGQQVHLKSGANLILDAGVSITLKGGGQHIVIGPGGIFSSTEIQIGGAPAAGTVASPLAPGVLAALHAPPETPEPVDVIDDVDLEEEEEEEELEPKEDSPAGVTLRFGMFFDGTLNNAANTALGLLCGASHPIRPEDLDSSCKPYMSDPESSYAGDQTNIKKLSDLYSNSIRVQIEDQLQWFSRAIYVEGIGTISGGADIGLGAALGRGETGVSGKVERSFNQINEIIYQFSQENPNIKITRLTFDVFGFSRGAAAARHFANEVALGQQGPLGQTMKIVRNAFHDTFKGEYLDDIHVSFIGLFDTVASIGGLDNFGYIRSQTAPGIKLFLSRELFPNVVQLSARDEIRANFPLERVKPQHPGYTVPGVHSDVGGSYFPETEECLLISPMQALDVPVTTDVRYTSIYRDALQAKAKWEAKGWPSEMLEVVTPYVRELPDLQKGRPNPNKRVYAALQLKRKVRGELSRVYLRVMYEQAKRKGVPFNVFDNQKASHALPEDLQAISDRFVSGDYTVTPEEDQMLMLKYIHVSANWNAPKSLQGSIPRTSAKLVYVNAPTTDGVRVQFPHVAD